MRLVLALVLLLSPFGHAWGQPGPPPGLPASSQPITEYDPGCTGALDGAKDVAAGLQAALNNVAQKYGRGTLYLIDPRGCLTASADITVPAGVTLKCADTMPVLEPADLATYGSRPCEIGARTTGVAGIKVMVTGKLSGVEVINPHIVAPTSTRTAINMLAAYAGIGVQLPPDNAGPGGQDAQVENVNVIGFNTCYDLQTIRPWLNNDFGDCTNGLTLANIHDVGHIRDIHFVPEMTTNQPWVRPVYSVIGVANSAGLVQLTLSGADDIQVGDFVNVYNVGGRPALTNRWTVATVSTSGGNTLVTLAGSSFAGPVVTGTLAVGSQYVTGLSSTANFAAGQAISAASGDLPGGTTISWFNATQGVALLSAAATGSATNDTLTVTAGTFTSGGSLAMDTALRHGTAFNFSTSGNSQQVFFASLFEFGWDKCFLAGANSAWATIIGLGCDTNGANFDPTTVALDFEGNSQWNVVSGVVIQSYGIAIKVNSTYTPDAVLIMNGSNYFGGFVLGAEFDQGISFLNGELTNSAPIFVGATAQVHYSGRNPALGYQFQTAASTNNLFNAYPLKTQSGGSCAAVALQFGDPGTGLFANAQLTGIEACVAGIVSGVFAQGTFQVLNTASGVIEIIATTNPAVSNMTVGNYEGLAFNSAGIQKAFSLARTGVVSPTSGSEESFWSLFLYLAGAQVDVLDIRSGHFTVGPGYALGMPQASWTDNQSCKAGEISVDAGFIYVCTATNTVKRVALSSF